MSKRTDRQYALSEEGSIGSTAAGAVGLGRAARGRWTEEVGWGGKVTGRGGGRVLDLPAALLLQIQPILIELECFVLNGIVVFGVARESGEKKKNFANGRAWTTYLSDLGGQDVQPSLWPLSKTGSSL